MQSSSKPLIYLASASPRRSALLSQIGVAHEVRPVDVDETTRPDEGPGRYVLRLARRKAETLWSSLREADRRAVLGADTTVAIDGHILGKPRDGRQTWQPSPAPLPRVRLVARAQASRDPGRDLATVDPSQTALVPAELDLPPATPGQALGYMIGALKIIELGDRAKARLAERFDLRRFHNAVIDQGALPLDLLESAIDEWVAAETVASR